jgi:tRNA(Arg) A34 adenosine deaminase TadA
MKSNNRSDSEIIIRQKVKLIVFGGAIVLTAFFLFIIILSLLSHSTVGVTDSDKHFIGLAYEEAVLALESGDAPVGAVLVVNEEVIAKSHNTVIEENDYRNHAEMNVLNEALKILGIASFNEIEGDVTLYTTYEPCAMCEGFIIWKKVPRVVVGKKKYLPTLFLMNYWPHFSYRFNERAGLDEYIHEELFEQWREKKYHHETITF